MKLHLPKSLFSAVLAVMTLAAPAVVSLGSATWAYGVTGTETWTSEAPKVLQEDITVDSGDNLTISSGDHSTTGQLELKNGGNASMSGGSLTAGSLRIHNAGSSTKETFTLSNGKLNLTGTGSGNQSTILIGHWPNGTGELVVTGGTLNAVDGTMTIGWDSNGLATISGGVVNVGSVRLRTPNESSTTLDGGRLNVGSGGITIHTQAGSVGGRLNLLSGTLGSLHKGDMAVSGIQNVSVGKITVDTDVWDAVTGATATGDKAGVANIKLLGNLTAAEGGMSINLAGAGSLTVNEVLDGTVTLASGSTAKLVFDAGTDFTQSSEVIYEGASTDKSGFMVTARIAAEGSTFHDNKVYIAGNDTAVSVSDGVANFSGMWNTFFVNDEQSYTIAADSRADKFIINAGGSLSLTASVAATFNSSGYIVNHGTLNLGSGEYNAAANGSIQGNVTMGQGAALTSSANGSIQGNVTVGNGATLTFAHSSGAVGNVYGHVTVENGGKLIFTTKDVTGYNGGANATTITVNRGGILELNRDDNETCAGTLTLNGTLKAGDGISNAMWDLYGGNASIVVSENENASIESVELRLRGSDRYVDVKDNAQLTISGKINNSNGGNNVFIKKGNGTLVLNGNYGVGTLKVEAGQVTVNGNATGATNGVFTKQGNGEFFLNGTYTAATLKVEAGTMTLDGGDENQQMLKNATINGRLNVESTDAFSYNSDGTVTVSGGTLALNARQTVDSGNNVILTAGRIIGDGGRYSNGGYVAGFDVHDGSDFKITSTGASEVATGIGLRNEKGNVVFNVESDKLGVSGVVAGVGGLKKEGNGTLMLTANNTYSGATTITAGTLQIGDGGAVSGTSGISIAEGAALEFVGKTDKTVTQAITGAGSVTMSGFGTVTLSGNVGTAADALGALKVNSGTLALQGTSYVADVMMGGGISIQNTGTLTLSGTLTLVEHGSLIPTGSGKYSGGTSSENGFYTGDYLVISGGNIQLGTDFKVEGTGVTGDYDIVDDGLVVSVADNSTFVVNTKETLSAGVIGKEGFSHYHINADGILDTGNPDTLPVSVRDLLESKLIGRGTLLISKSNLNTSASGTEGGGAGSDFKITTTFGGKVELAAGVTFSLGRHTAGDAIDSAEIDTSSLTGFVLNGGSMLQYNGNGNTSIANLHVKDDASTEARESANIRFVDGNKATAVQLTGTTRLDGNLNLTSQYDGAIRFHHLTGAGSLIASKDGETFNLSIDSLADFTGSLSFTSKVDDPYNVGPYNVTVNTGSAGADFTAITLVREGGGALNFTFNVEGKTAFDELIIKTNSAVLNFNGEGELVVGTIDPKSTVGNQFNIASGLTLNLTGSMWLKNSYINLAEDATFKTGKLTVIGTGNESSITRGAAGGVFSITDANHTIANSDVTVTSAGAATLAMKLTNSSLTNAGAGTLTVTNAGNTITSLHAQEGDVVLSSNMGLQQAILGDNKSLTLDYVLSSKNDDGSGNAGNSDTVGSLELAISGGAGSKLYIKLDGSDVAQNWQSNNTVRLTKLADQTKTVDEVHASGALATSVFNNANTRTDLGGAKLVMADESRLVVRKSGTYDLGASSIQLNGATTFWSYSGVSEGGAKITNSITGKKLVLGAGKGTGENGEGHLELNGALDLQELHVNSAKPTLSGAAEKKLQKLTVSQGNMLQIASGSSMQLVDSAKNTGVTFSASAGTAATLKGVNATGTLAQLQNAAAFSIADMELRNVSVSAATAGTAVNLTNITASAVQLAQGSFTMTDQAVVDFHGVEGSKACFTTDLLSGITLNNAGNAASLAVDLGDLADVADLQDGKTYDLSITLNGFTMMNYEIGTGLVFAADSWLGQLLAEHGYVSGSLEAPEALASTSPVKVTYTGIAGEGGANVGTIVTITGLGEVVPEPTTATLSLLALMGLAARRRRK